MGCRERRKRGQMAQGAGRGSVHLPAADGTPGVSSADGNSYLPDDRQRPSTVTICAGRKAADVQKVQGRRWLSRPKACPATTAPARPSIATAAFDVPSVNPDDRFWRCCAWYTRQCWRGSTDWRNTLSKGCCISDARRRSTRASKFNTLIYTELAPHQPQQTLAADPPARTCRRGEQVVDQHVMAGAGLHIECLDGSHGSGSWQNLKAGYPADGAAHE